MACFMMFWVVCLLRRSKFAPARCLKAPGRVREHGGPGGFLKNSSRCSGACHDRWGGSGGAPGGVRELHVIVLEALGVVVEVFGGPSSRPQGSMSTKCRNCQRFEASQKAINAPALAPGICKSASGRLRGMPPEALRARL